MSVPARVAAEQQRIDIGMMGPRDRAHSRRGVSRCGCDDDDDDMKMNDFQMMRHVFVRKLCYCSAVLLSLNDKC